MTNLSYLFRTTLACSSLALTAPAAFADQVILDDLIVQGSACIGIDCSNGESFGFDTLRLKENNLRIKAQDTSTSASFPSTDWQLTFNESANGGANKFSVDDITAGRTPFTIEGGSPTNALYVDDGGRLGFGTSTPVVELHVKDGDSPTLRLEQDGSSGFTAQTWDLAGNETNFFIRDATNGSTLPFRIRPSAPSSSIDIAGDGNVGFGTSGPTEALHVRRVGSDVNLLVEAATANQNAALRLDTATGTHVWQIMAQDDSGRLNIGVDVGGVKTTPLKIDENADNNLLKLGDNVNSDAVIVTGQIIVNGTAMNVPDYVFEPEYNLLPLAEVDAFIAENGHLPGVPSAKQINDEKRFNVVDMQLKLLEKIEELTLYTLAQEKTISALQAEVQSLSASK